MSGTIKLIKSEVKEPEIIDGNILITDNSIVTTSKYDDLGKEIEKTREI